MAYIPDEAVYDGNTLTDSAFKIYCLLCARRNHRSETTVATASTIVRLTGISKATVYRSLHELEQKQWIERNTNVYRLTKGDFSPMANRFNGSLKNETKSLSRETQKSQPRDTHNIHHGFKTIDLNHTFVEATGPRIDQIHEEATNGTCPYCQNAGVLKMKDGSLRTCRCQPVLLEI